MMIQRLLMQLWSWVLVVLLVHEALLDNNNSKLQDVGLGHLCLSILTLLTTTKP